ncbi:ParB N-terminal domain-containing protein [Marixanthomonas spongiae]|uniref:Uncharacterized protein n=1 Tax=Marixanthomonas spongiae TaxID=2174845 RepID=A0A2U0HVF2_9FLAO|nr:ParB N-terminal domain-containing protein [Marixanthomonas spongiae]PVW12851.1 hypothetical protein DDV96_14600 [Marixanthomonas spongiae]
MNRNYDWLVKKTPRSVDQLKLWPENPRLNPEETHLTLKEYAEDLTIDKGEKNDFFALVNSIVADGFVPADPVVVWQNKKNKKYYVAEGNRRVIALKLLREPKKSPKSIRSFIRKASSKINITTIEKIPVNVAPSFEDAEWYINQRNSSSTLQRRWSRVQQQRWIVTLYQKHNGDLDRILSVTKLTKSEIEGIIRTLKIKDFVKLDIVKDNLSTEEFELADSYRFPITVLERFFSFADVKEKWGIEYDGLDVNIISNEDSFYASFTELIKRIVNKDDDKINTRLRKEDLEEVLDSLPTVIFASDQVEEKDDKVEEKIINNDKSTNGADTSGGSTGEETEDKPEPGPEPINHLKDNPDRTKMVLKIYSLNTDSYRLLGLFNEFKRISLGYKNIVSSSLRVFVDLAVFKYIETEGIESDLSRFYRDDLRNIPLKKRLEYIKTNKLAGKPQNIVGRLLDPTSQYSLDVLNGFIHSQDTHYLNRQFLNSFWDFLFPLFQELLDIREI